LAVASETPSRSASALTDSPSAATICISAATWRGAGCAWLHAASRLGSTGTGARCSPFTTVRNAVSSSAAVLDDARESVAAAAAAVVTEGFYNNYFVQ